MLAISIVLSALAAVVPCVVASPAPAAVAAAPAATSTAKLNQVAKSRGKLYLGSATDNPELTNTTYLAMLSDNTMFGQLTAANSMKWVSMDFTTES